jgi:surfactin synthase thioesterase subunit
MSNVDLLDALVSMGGVSARGEAEELLKLTLPIIRSDLSASEVHRFLPLSPLNERIAVYSGDKDILVRQNILPRWANLTRGSTSLRTFDGGHFYMLEQTEEFVARLQEDVLGVP